MSDSEWGIHDRNWTLHSRWRCLRNTLPLWWAPSSWRSAGRTVKKKSWVGNGGKDQQKLIRINWTHQDKLEPTYKNKLEHINLPRIWLQWQRKKLVPFSQNCRHAWKRTQRSWRDRATETWEICGHITAPCQWGEPAGKQERMPMGVLPELLHQPA